MSGQWPWSAAVTTLACDGDGAGYEAGTGSGRRTRLVPRRTAERSPGERRRITATVFPVDFLAIRSPGPEKRENASGTVRRHCRPTRRPRRRRAGRVSRRRAANGKRVSGVSRGDRRRRTVSDDPRTWRRRRRLVGPVAWGSARPSAERSPSCRRRRTPRASGRPARETPRITHLAFHEPPTYTTERVRSVRRRHGLCAKSTPAGESDTRLRAAPCRTASHRDGPRRKAVFRGRQ